MTLREFLPTIHADQKRRIQLDPLQFLESFPPFDHGVRVNSTAEIQLKLFEVGTKRCERHVAVRNQV